MNTNPEGWGRRALGALVLLLAIAYVARWIYSLLLPLVPVACSLLGVGIAALLIFRRRR